MSITFQFKLTQIGHAAVWNANNTGMALSLTHIQFGSGNSTPTGAETALLSPQQATTIAAGFAVSATQIRMSAIFGGSQNYVIREVGLWAGDPAVAGSKLVGYWSQASGDLAMKSPGVDFIFSHDMTLDTAVPAGSLTILVDNTQSALLAMIAAHESAANPHNQYAPKNSPQLTGVPLAPTPAPFDNSAKLATTAFVKTAGLQSAAFTSYAAAATLTNSDLGKAIALYGSTPYTITLPVSSATNAGSMLAFTAVQGSTAVTIAGQTAQTIQVNNNALAAMILQVGDTLTLVSGGSGWYVIGGSAQAGYGFTRHAIAPASRVAGVNYTNTTGKLMTINACFGTTGADMHATIGAGGTGVGDYCLRSGYGARVTFTVLPGEVYYWTYNPGLAVPTLLSWYETY